MSGSDARSELGAEDFSAAYLQGVAQGDHATSVAGGSPEQVRAEPGPSRFGDTGGLVRDAPTTAQGWGRGPVPIDARKYRFDVMRGLASAPVSFNATLENTLDASVAGDLLDRIHRQFGIHNQSEARLIAFDNALFLEHTFNGASQLQSGRGGLFVGEMNFDIVPILNILGDNLRRFFRAYADDIAEVNKKVLADIDEYDVEKKEKAKRVMNIAQKRGLLKFPYLAHDSSDACVNLTTEEMLAVQSAKPYSLPAVNMVDDASIRFARANRDARRNVPSTN